MFIIQGFACVVNLELQENRHLPGKWKDTEVSSISPSPVKNYRRGIADFIGVILLKRRRIAKV